jgi:hypothetical protein
MSIQTPHPVFSILWALMASLLLGCAAGPSPEFVAEGNYLDRMQTQERQGMRVSAAVPSARESRDLFGINLYRRGIQPVWLRIENETDHAVNFLPVGLDPQYYTPLEVANVDADEKQSPMSMINRYFLEQGMALRVEGGQERSGFIFSKLDEGTKAFNVDIVAEGLFETFTFFIPVPGLNIDHYSVDWQALYAEEEWRDFESDALVDLLEQSPCCVTNKNGSGSGDPLNLILIGHPLDIYTAFIRAGWDETEAIDRSSSWKTFKSFVGGGEYRYSPISSLYVFGRPQDVAFQKARENIHERNHLRLWMSSATYQGIPVWLGQISRDIGVRFTTKTITTHKIDPDVDETREFLLENIAYAQSLKAFGYVRGVGGVPIDEPRGNLTGDPWFTDGYRLVLWVSPEPVPLSEIGYLDWRNPSKPD